MKRMAKLQNWRIISVFFLGLCCAAASAWGEPITVKVTGVVNSIDFPTDSVQVGSSMVGFCSYDTETPDEDPSDYRGTYDLNHLAMAIGNYTFTHNSASSEPALFDVWKTDMAYRAQCFYGIATESGLPLSFYHVNIKLIDLCNASVGGPDDLLPVTFPDISFFTWRNEFEVTFSQSGTGYQIQGELTSIEVVSEPPLPRVIYVDDDAPPGGDGLSWPTAYKYLQDALDDAGAGDEIRVAAGTYYPSVEVGGTGDRYRTFQLINGVAIYGGFPDIGNPNMADRDPNQHETILSGDLAGNDIINPNKTENSYHVVTSSGTDPNTILDGFTITGGNANHPIQLYFYYGGGMYNWDSNLTVTNCIFTGSSARFGGGMGNLYGSSPTVINCSFISNSATESGGGISNYYSSIKLTNCTLSSNSAGWNGGGMENYKNDSIVKGCTFTGNSAADNGGGMYNTLSSPTVTGCIFSGNLADKDGGGMYNYFYNYFSRPIVSSCTFIGNSANRSGGGMYNSNYSSPTVTNCVFTGNVADKRGGGMHIYRLDSPTVTNCTFSGNSADYGGGLYIFYNSSPTVTNCILYGNTSSLGGNEIALGNPSYSYPSKIDVDHCNVQGGQAGIFDDGSGNTINWGVGNIDTDPKFVFPNGTDGIIGTEDDNLRLSAASQCIDVGDNSVVDANIPDLDGNPRIINGIVDMGAYELFYTNTRPVADAGADRTVYAWIDGIAQVGLDGSGSFDADGDELDYFWFEGDEQIATGVDPNVQLSVGQHIIELIVNDGSEDSEPNAVVITVIGPVEADVYIVPRVINRNNRMKRVMAIIRLPEGIGRRDISDEPFVIEPGGVEASWQRVIGWRRRASVFALFDKAELMNAVEHNGRVELTVVGRLESGQYIHGSDTVRIVQPRRQRPRWRHGRRWR